VRPGGPEQGASIEGSPGERKPGASTVNPAPVRTQWATAVAQRMGFSADKGNIDD